MTSLVTLIATLALAASAMIDTPPSAAKAKLIAEFLVLSGTQAEIDNGRAVESLAMRDGGESMLANADKDGRFNGPIVGGPLTIVNDAYQQAYLRHKPEFQREYAKHVNWEFTEEELRSINAFLRSSAGKHYLDGAWRMHAYVDTNTEGLIAIISADAKAVAKKALIQKGLKPAPALDKTVAEIKSDMGIPNDR